MPHTVLLIRPSFRHDEMLTRPRTQYHHTTNIPPRARHAQSDARHHDTITRVPALRAWLRALRDIVATHTTCAFCCPRHARGGACAICPEARVRDTLLLLCFIPLPLMPLIFLLLMIPLPLQLRSDIQHTRSAHVMPRDAAHLPLRHPHAYHQPLYFLPSLPRIIIFAHHRRSPRARFCHIFAHIWSCSTAEAIISPLHAAMMTC